MRQMLINSIRARLITEISPHNPLRYLRTLEIEKYIDSVIAILYLYTRIKKNKEKPIYLTEVISAIGHKIRNKFKLPKDSALAAKTGAFILYSFEDLNIICVNLGPGEKGHATYMITVIAEKVLNSLWKKLPLSTTEKLPSLKPYADWKVFKHESGVNMVKTENKYVMATLKPEIHPLVFGTLNKAQHIGWRINLTILNIANYAFVHTAECFSDIWNTKTVEARTTKLRETACILDMAERFKDDTFYHLYTLDFR